nr:retrovirus-related Pol polyprotein from transposon TNT 1-94 [Tanacetum cinerariifolium]
MSNTNNTMQTQTSNALHNAIMETGGKDRSPMLAPGNYVQWKSKIKRYIDAKPNHELIHYCLRNLPYEFKWNDKVVPVTKGGTETTTERYMENYKNVSQDIRDQLNAEAEAVQTILTGIDNDIYSIVDACPNACEMWKAIERYDREQIDHDDDLAHERDLLASLIEKLKCEIDDSKNRNKFLETSNKALVDKLQGQIKDFKTTNKSLESSNNLFKEANNELSKTNQLMYKDLKKFQAELDKYHDVKYASKVEIDCAKSKEDLMSYKMEYEKTKMPMVVLVSTREPKRIVNQSVATPLRRTVALESTNQKPRHITRKIYEHLVEIILFIVNSGCSEHMTGNLKLLTNFVEKFLGSVKFGNDQIAPILGYGDLVQGTVTIKRVYYIEGLNHNLFSFGQFCDADLEVAFRKSTYLYSITLQDTSSPNPICLMAKATSSQAWLWHRRLSHLNFDTINLILKNDIVIGLLKLKLVKDHLCSSCCKNHGSPLINMNTACDQVEFRRISLTGFRSCASRSQTETSQSKQSME